MNQDSEEWSKTVFRVRGLPNDVRTLQDVASLLSLRLADIPGNSIQVYSLATTLIPWDSSRPKIATVMFQNLPSLIQKSPEEKCWSIPAEDYPDTDTLILDTEFLGITPLNDVDSAHSFDCIAISGRASHPFGSWQPKGADKTFMWIRDALPKHLSGARAVIYGYDTKLKSSQSFQLIPDLAKALISQLQAHGWSMPSAKPVVFLVHSLGGLLLREVIVQLDSSSNEEYKCLLGVLRGAVFFGVPNLGMEQSHFRTIVDSNPNEALVDDISRNSNYLRRLNELFPRSSFQSRLKCFWAYETLESPTVQKTTDGKIDRNGTPAILVSRESATCRFIETNPSITFPIDETHSNMVKFTRDSQYYHIVISKISSILSLPTYNIDPSLRSIDKSKLDIDGLDVAYHKPTRNDLEAELDMFRRMTGLTEIEQADLKCTSYSSLLDFIRTLQEEQERNDKFIYMQRLKPFLVSMKEYVEAAEIAELFVDISDVNSYLWGPMKYILDIAQSYSEAFHSVLDVYQQIGEQIAACLSFQRLFSSPHMRYILAMLYKDILDFHKDIIRHFKKRDWKQLFKASWRIFVPRINHIKANLRRHKLLIESGASLKEFEEIQKIRQDEINTLGEHMKEQDFHRRDIIKSWICHFDCETQQQDHQETRKVCKDPGRWLIDNHQFQEWFGPDFCSKPLLWVNGIPGAGKTILASVVVDEARLVQNSTVAFFYCKHDDKTRNSFIAVARSILAQILSQNDHLVPYFYENACVSDAILISASVAEEMLQTTLNSCEKTYIIIDGLDECGQEERKKISSWFLGIVEALPPKAMDSIRCLFVSQYDGIVGNALGHLPTIKITTENREDVKDFATVWQKKMEKKFGSLQSNGFNIANIISARAQGMFIFAKVLAKYLHGQLSKAALLEELKPAKLPVKLDDVYKRILDRVLESRSDDIVVQLQLILGWIVCAKRPLRWREIQGAISINMEQQHIDYDRKLLDSPRELFASFVEVESDGTVKLIHETAREYLVRTKFVQPRDVDYSLSMLSLAYLAFPQVDKGRSDDDVAADLASGIHAFYDYASACWAIHLQAGIPSPDVGDKLSHLLETLETFIELHWSLTSKSLKISEKVQVSLSPMKASECYDRISQAVEWSRKQLGSYCQGPNPDEALSLWQVTEKIRSVLEKIHSHSFPEIETKELDQFYGSNWFKCPRVSCYYYHQGFSSASQKKNHVDRHDRPFLCIANGCPMNLFGCPTENELKKHIFEYHGIDEFDGSEYPPQPKIQAHSTAKHPATFHCPKCPKSFTKKFNLDGHLRTHDGTKPFECGSCDKSFTRKSDCDRHEKGHGEKKFACFGHLKDGSTWGCQAYFGRADKLAAHLKTKTGLKCLRPLVLQKLREGGESSAGENILSDQLGTNADALLAAGKLLPSFGDFLRLCGLDKSAIS